MTASDIEQALVKHYGRTQHLIVPNLSWGLLEYECDLFVVRKSGYCFEIEIKVSSADIAADLQKQKWINRGGIESEMFGRVGNNDYILREFWMAVPEELEDDINMPKFAGILSIKKIVYNKEEHYYTLPFSPTYRVKVKRKPKIWTRARKIQEVEKHKLNYLLGLRYWNLKEKLYKLKKKGE